jgi:tRNA(Phe) wybutosine-synthesizing methylase Tyw3
MPKFVEQKAAALRGQDLSRKGSVDEPIRNLVNFINSKSQYFTTSSCSGRILVLADQLKHDQVFNSYVSNNNSNGNMKSFRNHMVLPKKDVSGFTFPTKNAARKSYFPSSIQVLET